MDKAEHKGFFILPTLNCGGAERVMVTIVNELAERGLNVHLIVLLSKGSLENKLSPKVKLTHFGSKKTSLGVLRLGITIWKAQPHFVFSTLGHLNLLIGLCIPFLPRKTKYYARETSIPSIINKSVKKTFIHNFLYKFVYNRFNCIISQCEAMRIDLVKNYAIDPDRISVLHNPIAFPACENTFQSIDKSLIAVGRICPQKRFDLLLKAFSLLPQDYTLTILGDGEQANELKELADKLGIQGRITFAGYISDPTPFLRASQLFILTSEYEGLPNVAIEANACGTPVVAFECPGGISEIVNDGINGFLVPFGEVALLAAKVERAIQHPFDNRLIMEKAYEQFSLEHIGDKYQALLYV